MSLSAYENQESSAFSSSSANLDECSVSGQPESADNSHVESMIPIEIELIGTDAAGRPFSEPAGMAYLSSHGALIVSSYALATDQQLTIRRLNENREVEIRVIGVISGSDTDESLYGVVFVDGEMNSWDREVPPRAKLAPRSRQESLHCGVCRSEAIIQLNEIELHVLETNHTVELFCKRCSSTTAWKSGHALVVEHAPQLRPADEPKLLNRNYGRVRITSLARIRNADFSDEIVRCENFSRGGVCFKTQRPYSSGGEIEISLPYSEKLGGNIFLPARIVNVHQVSKIFIVHAAYLKKQQKQYIGCPPSTT